MTYATLNDWLGEIENYATREERLLTDFDRAVLPWLETAWRLGAEAEREACARIAYHSQCDPQGRVEMLERALRRIAGQDYEPITNPAGEESWTLAAAEIARAALAYKPAQMKGREG